MNAKPFAALNDFTVPVSFMFPLLLPYFLSLGSVAISRDSGPSACLSWTGVQAGATKGYPTVQGLEPHDKQGQGWSFQQAPEKFPKVIILKGLLFGVDHENTCPGAIRAGRRGHF